MRSNILLNVAGGAWFAVLSLVLIPVQVRVLGVETYGLLAFLISLQTIFSVCDVGMSPSITRFVATDRSPDLQASYAAIGAVLPFYALIGIGLGSSLILISQFLTHHWLQLHALSVASSTMAIVLWGVVIAVRWPVTFLAGILTGLQRFSQLNLLKIGVSTISLLGGICVILLTRSVTSFLAWSIASAGVEVLSYSLICARYLNGWNAHLRIRIRPIAPLLHLALGIAGINLLAIVVTQVDKLLLSKLISAQQLGYYAVAYNLVYGLSLLQTLVNAAVFPAFSADYEHQRLHRLQERYRKALQSLAYVYLAPLGVCAFFATDILSAWTSRSLADHAAIILPILAIGFFLNTLASIGYTLSIAAGDSRLPMMVNIAGVLVYLPLLLITASRFGGTGAAACWVFLNLYYMVVLVPLVQTRFLPSPRRAGLDVVGRLLLAAVACFGGARVLTQMTSLAVWPALLCAGAACLCYLAIGMVLLDAPLRADLRAAARQAAGMFTRRGDGIGPTSIARR